MLESIEFDAMKTEVRFVPASNHREEEELGRKTDDEARRQK